MIKNITSLVLLIISVSLNLKHGWDSLNYNNNPSALKMMNELGINDTLIPYLGALIIIIGLMLLIPGTFFIGNVLNAISIILIMALALRAGNYRIAIIEIPFLIIPLLLIWLKHPFKN